MVCKSPITCFSPTPACLNHMLCVWISRHAFSSPPPPDSILHPQSMRNAQLGPVFQGGLPWNSCNRIQVFQGGHLIWSKSSSKEASWEDLQSHFGGKSSKEAFLGRLASSFGQVFKEAFLADLQPQSCFPRVAPHLEHVFQGGFLGSRARCASARHASHFTRYVNAYGLKLFQGTHSNIGQSKTRFATAPVRRLVAKWKQARGQLTPTEAEETRLRGAA